MSDPSRSIRIVLAEDHALVREGTRQALDQEPDFCVVGEAGDGNDALELILRLRPDVAILDIRMPGLNAIEVTRRLQERSPGTRVLILTAYGDDDYVLAAVDSGAQGYLLKTARLAELVAAVRALCRGAMVFHPDIAGRMAQLLRRRPGAEHRVEGLTPREMEVLQLAARGLRNRDIALHLGVSPRTVEGHFSNVLSKLGVASRTAAVMVAVAQGWVSPEGAEEA